MCRAGGGGHRGSLPVPASILPGHCGFAPGDREHGRASPGLGEASGAWEGIEGGVPVPPGIAGGGGEEPKLLVGARGPAPCRPGGPTATEGGAGPVPARCDGSVHAGPASRPIRVGSAS